MDSGALLWTVEISHTYLLAYISRRVKNNIWDKTYFLEANQTITTIEMNPKNSSKAASDLQERGQTEPPSESRNPKDKRHKSKGSRTGTANPIPRKAYKPSRDTGMLCGLYNKYGGAATSYITSDCKSGGQVPARPILNGDGRQPQLNNSTPMLLDGSAG